MFRPMDDRSQSHLACRVCGCTHEPVELRWGERALCTRCGSTLTRHGAGHDATLAYTLTALILAIPAGELPIVHVRKFGLDHASYLWTSVQALWQDRMPLLAIWVGLCGIVVPLVLVATLLVIAFPARFRRRPTRFWVRFAHALQHWSMPEVQVLAVLVAFVKIGALVHVDVGLGLWFYGGMAVAMLLGWQRAELPEGGQ